MKLGSKNIADVLLGQKGVSKIYKGDTIVWEKGGGVPPCDIFGDGSELFYAPGIKMDNDPPTLVDVCRGLRLTGNSYGEYVRARGRNCLNILSPSVFATLMLSESISLGPDWAVCFYINLDFNQDYLNNNYTDIFAIFNGNTLLLSTKCVIDAGAVVMEMWSVNVQGTNSQIYSGGIFRDTWKHVCVCFSETAGYNIFIDSTLVKAEPMSLKGNMPVGIQVVPLNFTGYYEVMPINISDLCIFNRWLSHEEILQVMNRREP